MEFKRQVIEECLGGETLKGGRAKRSAAEKRNYMLRDNQDENAPSNRMRIARGFGGAGRSPEPT
jgi:hypothetical protein